jgi:6-phosphogluconolactonase
MDLKIVSDLNELSISGAEEFSRCAREAINDHGRFFVALSGGSTPQGTYSLLAQQQNDPAKRLAWEKIHMFFGDERHVPPTHHDSNFRMANESLLSRIQIPQENIHRIEAELDATVAASKYEDDLRKFFHTGDPFPRFDLIMLGVGPCGHTASLFPDTTALGERSRWVVANCVPKFNSYRITFTFPVINHGSEVMFQVSGQDKSDILKEVFRQDAKEDYPCQKVQPLTGRLLWIVDKAAAKLLGK